MSPEQVELKRLAVVERRSAWLAAKRIPARAGDAVSAFARVHPMWAAGGAAAIAMVFVARKRRAPLANGRTESSSGGRTGSPSVSSSWPTVAAVGVRFLPDLLRMVGLTTPSEPKNAVEETEPKTEPPDPMTIRT